MLNVHVIVGRSGEKNQMYHWPRNMYNSKLETSHIQCFAQYTHSGAKTICEIWHQNALALEHVYNSNLTNDNHIPIQGPRGFSCSKKMWDLTLKHSEFNAQFWDCDRRLTHTQNTWVHLRLGSIRDDRSILSIYIRNTRLLHVGLLVIILCEWKMTWLMKSTLRSSYNQSSDTMHIVLPLPNECTLNTSSDRAAILEKNREIS